MLSKNPQSSLDLFHSLDDHGSSCSAAVADGREAVLARLQLVKQGGENAGARASKSMAQGDGATKGVDTRVLEAKDLHGKGKKG